MNDLTAQSLSASSHEAAPEGGISLGLGLTNECNLACAFCYRDPTRTDRLSLDQVKAVMDRLPLRSVNLGTGENGMHPEFETILTYLRTKPVKLTITSNGHSVAALEDNELHAFHDIEFSLDYPTQAEQDAQRGPGNWALIHQQAERCMKLAIPVTIVAVMMKSNYLRLADVARVAKQFNAPLRVNVYQSVRSDIYALSYEEYWERFRRLFEETDVIRDWRAARSRNGRAPAAPSRLWREHRASDAKSHDATLRLLARIGRAAFGFDLRRRRHFELSAFRGGTDTS
jgi:MoaA/NifB/PqqE/SkfB family radical SAM enzyme